VSTALDLTLILLALAASAVFSGSETAFYSVSRARIDVEARQGVRSSRLVRRLLSDDLTFLIVVLIGNTLMVELMTWTTEDLLHEHGVPAWAIRTFLALVLTPCVFFFAEVLPKDLFRRRPHALLARTAPFVLFSRYLFWPLERLLFLFTAVLTRLFTLEPKLLSAVRGREAVLRLLSEGAREGAILPHAEQMARNVLKLRSIEVERCMAAWEGVLVLRLGGSSADLYAAVARLPVHAHPGRRGIRRGPRLRPPARRPRRRRGRGGPRPPAAVDRAPVRHAGRPGPRPPALDRPAPRGRGGPRASARARHAERSPRGDLRRPDRMVGMAATRARR
jgi:CBS domain containing-hemolysin-like protein